ncbi:type 1 glutamine amidotransferase [Dyadobacter sp. LJ53]|uniref:type 1 glutamine amidotransferase domain-containing protein n=1 Tax=Dyadobacter chenwenxiniae TaxID=2906456 RepID=UPI001F24DAA1|nr:type 1 glutamine amidotransferase domain-containing protein [Dyadobacter chenwenxiniae]MCF0051688.1 type 1 glutamine amidotransferase [Dyadobacter chenwenxiniae]
MIATNGFEQAEIFEPRQALSDAGVTITLAALDRQPIHGVIYDAATGMSNVSDQYITPDISLTEVHLDDYDALFLPGGVISPDKLRMVPEAVEIVRKVNEKGMLIASICHGPWLLVEADAIRGKKVTGWYSIRTDLANAGAEVLDQEVVVDSNLITSRMPSDIPAFNRAFIQALSN